MLFTYIVNKQYLDYAPHSQSGSPMPKYLLATIGVYKQNTRQMKQWPYINPHRCRSNQSDQLAP